MRDDQTGLAHTNVLKRTQNDQETDRRKHLFYNFFSSSVKCSELRVPRANQFPENHKNINAFLTKDK